MKKLIKTAIAVALVGSLAGNAMARDGWGYRPAYGGPRYEHHHRHGSDWVGPAIALGVIGLAVGAALSQPSAPSPAYVAAPVPAPSPPPAPASAQYFCGSVGQYYPYTQYCPEGWQLVYPY